MAFQSCYIHLNTSQYRSVCFRHDQQIWTHLHGPTEEFHGVQMVSQNGPNGLQDRQCPITRSEENMRRDFFKTIWKNSQRNVNQSWRRATGNNCSSEPTCNHTPQERMKVDKSVADTFATIERSKGCQKTERTDTKASRPSVMVNWIRNDKTTSISLYGTANIVRMFWTGSPSF